MIWHYYLAASALVSIWNWRIALVFVVHIIVMQIVKHYHPGNLQVAFLVVHALTAAFAFVLLEKVGAFFLASISVVYALHVSGLVQQPLKQFSCETLFIAGLLLGSYLGPSTGLYHLTPNANSSSGYSGFGDLLSRIANRKKQDRDPD